MDLTEFSPGVGRRDELVFQETRALLEACELHPDFTVVGLIPRDKKVNEHEESIIVECDNRQVPYRNEVGIRPVELLKLVYNRASTRPYDVRALRDDFPLLNHQNAVPVGSPVSLCLYEAPWSHIARSWTPQRFLDRILWWLSRSSMNVLHEPTQPLEPLFYEGAFDLVLPADFLENWAVPTKRFGLENIHHGKRVTLRVVDIKPGDSTEIPLVPLVVSVTSVKHPPLAKQPSSLGTLAEIFELWNTNLEGPLRDAVRDYCQSVVTGQGQNVNSNSKVLLVILVPRSDSSDRVDIVACVVISNIARLGLALGVLVRLPGEETAYLDTSEKITGKPQLGDDSWKKFSTSTVSIRKCLDRASTQQLSAVDPSSADFKGVIAGYGALGSAMHRLFDRNGWGHWILVDDDEVAPHNLTRHIAFDFEIGLPKTIVGANHSLATYPTKTQPVALVGRINGSDAKILESVANAELLIDATADIGSARDISDSSHAARSASTFLTPSGYSSVMLLEDKGRSCRLLSLEAQYYRAVLENPWGQTHLDLQGSVRTGTTCRDLSFVLPNELVQLHAATLAFHLRFAVLDPNAFIGIWTHSPQTGAIENVQVVVETSHTVKIGGWNVGWDSGIEKKLRAYRTAKLPNETGGMLLGIIDTQARAIQVVDVTGEPPDSKGTSLGFIRGTDGVSEFLEDVRKLTVGAVGYAGDWHSHPDGHSASASSTDTRQLSSLAEQMASEGLPSLMVIVGEHQINWLIGSVCPKEGQNP